MSIFVFSNNGSALLASSISNSDTTATVQAGSGPLFPSIAAGQVAVIALEDVNGDIEIAYATSRTGDALTLVRGREGTTAIAFASGSRVENRASAAVFAAMLQKTGGDTLSGTTNLTGVLQLGSAGSIQGGEIAGTPIRGSAGETDNQILVPDGGGPATEGGSVILTKANILANLPTGASFALTNMIVAWHGLTSAIPAGWALCNGDSGTPDLRDRFIVGGAGSLPVTGTYAHTADAISAGTPVIDPVTLAGSNFPSHDHAVDFYGGTTGYAIGPPPFPPGAIFFAGDNGAGVKNTFHTGLNGGGTVAPFTPTADALPAHSHTIESPPYTAMLFIMKT